MPLCRSMARADCAQFPTCVSILMTSAPMSAGSMTQAWSASMHEQSRTATPGRQLSIVYPEQVHSRNCVVAEQDARKSAEQRLKKKIEAQQVATTAELSKTVLLTFMGQRYIPSDVLAGRIDDQFSVEIGVRNSGPKAIKGIKVQLVFKNTFGEVISKMHLNIEQAIPPGGEYVWKGSRKINEFIDEDRHLMHLKDGQSSAEMQPTMVVYVDGSTIGNPDAT